MMPLETSPFDPVDYLHDDEDIALFLDDAMEGGDLRHFAYALHTAARAKGLKLDEAESPTLDVLTELLAGAGLRLRVDRLAA